MLADNIPDLLNNFEDVLKIARMCGLTFKPNKIVVALIHSTLSGWNLSGSEWSPTDHTVSALSVAKLPNTVKQLRSFLGSFKQFTECVPSYAVLLHPLESMVVGRASADRLQWSDNDTKAFEAAKNATKNLSGVHIPNPTNQILTYSDYSAANKAAGGWMEFIRTLTDGSTKKLFGGYFQTTLDQHKANWLACKGEALSCRLVLHHFAPFIKDNDNVTIHHTDNLPCFS